MVGHILGVDIMKKKLLLSTIAAIVASAGIASATGIFQGFPVYGVPANTLCQSFGNGGVCTQYVPAGPTVLTGNETIPANTNLANGANPQSIMLTMASIGALPAVVVSPTAGSNTTIAATTGTLLVVPSGTLATVQFTLPAATGLVDGQTLRISSTQTLTSMTLTAGSGTIISAATNNNPTSLTPSATAPYGYEFIYNLAATTWYRIQ